MSVIESDNKQTCETYMYMYVMYLMAKPMLLFQTVSLDLTMRREIPDAVTAVVKKILVVNPDGVTRDDLLSKISHLTVVTTNLTLVFHLVFYSSLFALLNKKNTKRKTDEIFRSIKKPKEILISPKRVRPSISLSFPEITCIMNNNANAI